MFISDADRYEITVSIATESIVQEECVVWGVRSERQFQVNIKKGITYSWIYDMGWWVKWWGSDFGTWQKTINQGKVIEGNITGNVIEGNIIGKVIEGNR